MDSDSEQEQEAKQAYSKKYCFELKRKAGKHLAVATTGKYSGVSTIARLEQNQWLKANLGTELEVLTGFY